MYYSINPKWNEREKRWKVSLMRKGVRRQFTSSKPRSEGKKECREKALLWLEGKEDKDLPFRDVWARFMREYEDRNGTSEQLLKLDLYGRTRLIPALGDRRMSTIGVEDWQHIISDAKPIPRIRKDGSYFYRTSVLSKKTLKNIRESITMFLNWAEPRDYIEKNPAQLLYIPAAAPTVGKDILQLSQIEEWFQNPTGFWYERALMFTLLTGWRPGEVLGLKKSDYDPKKGIITMNRSLNARGTITPGKNKNARRALELTGEVRSIIEEQLRAIGNLRTDWIFPNQVGGPASQAKYRTCLQRIGKRFGFSENVTPYSLRHTFYTHIESYLPQRIIKTIFGHSEATESHALYGSHELDGELHEAAQRLQVTPLYLITRKSADNS